MKKYVIILACGILFSCDNKRSSEGILSEESEVAPETIPPSKVEPQVDGVAAGEEMARPLAVIDGRYQKLEKDDLSADCNCRCIDVDFNASTEICIVKDKIYINVRFEKTGESTANIYLVNVSREKNPERKFPWEEFDRNTPIASMEFIPDGTAELDWKGFNIGGEIATDYAIYGKKSLEGTYKKT